MLSRGEEVAVAASFPSPCSLGIVSVSVGRFAGADGKLLERAGGGGNCWFGTSGKGADRGGLCLGDSRRWSSDFIGGGVTFLGNCMRISSLERSLELSDADGNMNLPSSESGPTMGVNILLDLNGGFFSIIDGGWISLLCICGGLSFCTWRGGCTNTGGIDCRLSSYCCPGGGGGACS